MLFQMPADENPAHEDVWLYLDEMSHRALNTYAAVLAMVERAQREAPDAAGRGALQGIAAQLRSAAAAQRALRPSPGAGACRLDRELERTCAALSAALLEARSIELTLACDVIVLDPRRCWQTCLIVSELVMNAMRHAFAPGSAGQITVELRLRGNIVSCLVSDNGSLRAAANPGAGTRILDALASYLGGALVRRRAGRGVSVLLAFPLCRQTGGLA